MVKVVEDRIINLDPDKINYEDKDEVKAIIVALLNTVEQLVQENIKLREEVQQLKDEISELKGEKGKPKIKPNVPSRGTANPLAKSKGWSKGSKKDKVKVDRKVRISVQGQLPSDARLLCYRKVVIQDVILKTDNVAYLLERYYSPSLNRYYNASLPEEVKGSQFGSNLKALTSVLYFSCRVTENKICQLFREIGISISEGQISNIITKEMHEELTSEKQEIFKAGMNHAQFIQTDETGGKTSRNELLYACNMQPLFHLLFYKARQEKRHRKRYIWSWKRGMFRHTTHNR